MASLKMLKTEKKAAREDDLFLRIGQFLVDHRLSPDPINYSFAYRAFANPTGPLATTIAALTDGGVRLTREEIAKLGHRAAEGDGPRVDQGDALVARTQQQVESFEHLVQAMRAETQDFGRDLAASADAMRHADEPLSAEGFARMTGAMLERVRNAEERLESATREARELREMLEEARGDARRDPLTDLPNRRAFDEAFTSQSTAGAPLCVALCDIDRFKSVNDRFGHPVGDRVLKAIGKSLAESCPDHFVARHGGEEFVILFSGVDAAAASSCLDEAREAVGAKRWRLRETDAPLGSITFSAGLVTVAPGESLDDVLARADELLYAAKEAGRNCVKAD